MRCFITRTRLSWSVTNQDTRCCSAFAFSRAYDVLAPPHAKTFFGNLPQSKSSRSDVLVSLRRRRDLGGRVGGGSERGSRVTERATGGTSARNNIEKGVCEEGQYFPFLMGEPVVPPACVSRAPGTSTLAQRAHVLRGALTPACVSRAPDRARGCAAHRRPFLLHFVCSVLCVGPAGRRRVWEKVTIPSSSTTSRPRR